MSAPVIDPESSVLSYPQWVEWEHIFSATNTPTSWNVASGGFPTGMQFQPTIACTGNESADVITATGNSFNNGTVLMFGSITGGSGLTTGTNYFVVNSGGDDFQLAATEGGTPINFTTTLTAGTLFQPGQLKGAATVPGICTVRLTATNGSGTSPEVLFTIGIEPAALAPDASDDLAWNIATGDVIAQTSSVLSLTPAAEGVPVMTVKSGDDLLVRVRIFKSGTPLDLPATSLRLSLKELDPEAVVVLSTAWVKVGSGTNANYLVYAKVEGDELRGSLSNYEADAGTFYKGLAELEIVYSNAEEIGPETLVKSSLTFQINVVREITPNA